MIASQPLEILSRISGRGRHESYSCSVGPDGYSETGKKVPIQGLTCGHELLFSTFFPFHHWPLINLSPSRLLNATYTAILLAQYQVN